MGNPTVEGRIATSHSGSRTGSCMITRYATVVGNRGSPRLRRRFDGGQGRVQRALGDNEARSLGFVLQLFEPVSRGVVTRVARVSDKCAGPRDKKIDTR